MCIFCEWQRNKENLVLRLWGAELCHYMYLLTQDPPPKYGTKGLKPVWVKLHSLGTRAFSLFFCVFPFCVCALNTPSVSQRAGLCVHVFVCWNYGTSADYLLHRSPITQAAPFTTVGLKINLWRAQAEFSSLAACSYLI